MPERYSDEHLRFLQMGIPVYPGDEEIISRMAGQAMDTARIYTPERGGEYQQLRGVITGDPMAGNVTPRFGMDTNRQRTTNLGLPPAKRKVVKTVSADPAVADKVIETIEETLPSTTTAAPDRVRSQHDIMMEQFQTHKAANTVPSAGIFMQSAQAAAPEVGNDPPPQQDPEGNWWVWDWTKNAFVKAMQSAGGLGRTSVGELIVGPDLQPTQVGLDVQQVLTETTAERNARLARVQQPDQTDTGGGTTTPTTRVGTGPIHLPSTFDQGDVSARIYANWSRDIPTERKEYLRAMKDIYFKMSMLSAVASLTGGEDQSEGFGRMQVEMLNYMMETDNQERLLKIHKGVYFDKDGKWDPPKNERVAHQRAVRFGAGPEEASEFSGFYPKKTGEYQNWLVRNRATGVTETIASQGPPPGFDPEEYAVTLESMRVGVEKYDTWKRKFDAQTTPEGRRQVAKRWARELKRQSGMPIVSPITEAEIERAFAELAGDDISDLKVKP